MTTCSSKQLPQHIIHRAAGADILGAGQPLFEKAEEGGVGVALRFLVGNGDAAHGVQAEQGGDGKEREGRAQPLIDEEERDEDAEQQQDIPDDAQHQLREKDGKIQRIPLDALDEFPRAFLVVKAHIQPQAMRGQIFAQRIGGHPADILAHVGRAHGDRLLQQRDADEDNRRHQQQMKRFPGHGGIDEIAHDLRVHHLQTDAAQHQHRQQRETQ